MNTEQMPISTEKNWRFIVNALAHSTGFLEEIYDKAEASKDGREYPNLSEDIDTLMSLLRAAQYRAIENETIYQNQIE